MLTRISNRATLMGPKLVVVQCSSARVEACNALLSLGPFEETV